MRVAMVGGSDAGIEAARRIRELDRGRGQGARRRRLPELVASAACRTGTPREVPDWRDLAHRTIADLEATGMRLLLDHQVTGLRRRREALTSRHDGSAGVLGYDRLILATGANPSPADRRTRHLGPERRRARAAHHAGHVRPRVTGRRSTAAPVAVIVGAGYVGLEMAEALTTRGLRVVVVEQLPRCCRAPWTASSPHWSRTTCATAASTSAAARPSRQRSNRTAATRPRRIGVQRTEETAAPRTGPGGTGVRPATELAVGGRRSKLGAPARSRSTGDARPTCRTCGRPATASTPTTGSSTSRPTCRWAPPRTSRAESPARTSMGGSLEYAGSLGTQAVKLFDRVAAATGLRDDEAQPPGSTRSPSRSTGR